MKLGKNVVKEREAQNIAQKDLAKKAKMSKAHLSLIESGKRGASTKTVEKLAKALGVDPGVLMR